METPEPNLSRAMQWSSVSYSVWFSRWHGRWGHLFGGRFKGIVVEDDAGAEKRCYGFGGGKGGWVFGNWESWWEGWTTRRWSRR